MASWEGVGQPRYRFGVALLAAALVELALLGGFVLLGSVPKPVESGPPGRLRLSIHASPPKPPAPPPTPVPPPPVPPPLVPPSPMPPPPLPAAPLPEATLPEPTVASHRLRQRVPHPPRHASPVPHPAKVPTQAAPPQAAPPPAPPPSPPPAAPSPSETAHFVAALRRAMQASLIYPAGAQSAHERGVARVRFLYRDGVVSGAVLEHPTGFPVLDEAALRTVRDARVPLPPGNFKGQTLSIEVDLVFRAAGTDMEAD